MRREGGEKEGRRKKEEGRTQGYDYYGRNGRRNLHYAKIVVYFGTSSLPIHKKNR